MTTIVIPLHHGGGKLKDDSELRFALRSIAANFREDRYQVAIVGRRLPSWVRNVRFIEQRSKGLKTALRMAAEAYPAGFFWYYDDTCLLKSITAEEMKVTPCSRKWSQPHTGWARKLDSIRERLEAEGMKPWDYSRPHGPYWFDKGMIDEAFRDWPGMDGKLPFESWILSKRDWPRRHSGYKQYYGEFRGAPGDHQQYLNYNNAGFTDELRAWLTDRFPERSPFERAPIQLDDTLRLNAVVIGLPARPRWESACVADMAAVGIDCRIVPGFDGHAGIDAPMPVNAAAFRKDFKREVLPGEIGCFASHFQLATQYDALPPLCDALPGWRLTFEDDAIPSDIDAATLARIALLAEERDFDVVMLNAGKHNRRRCGDINVARSGGNDIFTHALLWNSRAAREIQSWEMRHPIDLAISKSKRMHVAVLWGTQQFDQRDPLSSSVSIHRERHGLPCDIMSTPPMTIPDAFEGISHSDHRRGCNKLARHGYGPMYEDLLAPLKGTAASIAEIGVATGYSLIGWRRYLGPDASIVGLDVDTSYLVAECAEVVHRIDARSPEAASLFADEALDLIIDDGSHKLQDQWDAFQVLWPKLKPGGRYVIEDIGDGFSFAVKFTDFPHRWKDTRNEAERHPWSLCAIFEKGDARGASLAAYTLRWGDEAWIDQCADSLEAWTERHGVELKVWGKPEDGKYPSPKFCIVEMLRDFVENSPAEFMLYIDADVMVHPDAPRFPVCPGFLAMTDRPHQNWGPDWEQWCQQHFGERPADFRYRNAGLWVCNKDSARRMLAVANPPFTERVQDQHQFNWWLRQAVKAGMHLEDLHPTWNRDSASTRPAWMWHLWGKGDKMAKLQRVQGRGLLGTHTGGGLLVADCAFQRKRGLGNRITLLCDAYATARVRGMEFAFTWTARRHCGATWTDLFQPLDGIEVLDFIPAGAEVRRRDTFYVGEVDRMPEFWEAWREMARMIRLADGLELPEVEPFDAISLRLTHPRGAYHNRQIQQLPRVARPFISSDCPQGVEWVREVCPDAWNLDPKLFNADDVPRDIDHMRGAARDMMMLTRARSILALGRESTFRNLAHIGYGVPVMRFYEGSAP